MDNPFKKLIEEWKKASPKEKLFIVGAAASIVAVALYMHNKTSSSSLAGTGTTGLPSSLSPGTGGTGSPGAIAPVPPQAAPGSAPGDPGSNPPNNPPYAPPPYTGTGTPYTPPANVSAAGAAVAQNVLASQHVTQKPKNIVLGSSPNLPPTVVYKGAPQANSPTLNAINRATLQNAVRAGQGAVLQPTATTQVYSGIRHAPAPAPVSTQQTAPPVRKPRAF